MSANWVGQGVNHAAVYKTMNLHKLYTGPLRGKLRAFGMTPLAAIARSAAY